MATKRKLFFCFCFSIFLFYSNYVNCLKIMQSRAEIKLCAISIVFRIWHHRCLFFCHIWRQWRLFRVCVCVWKRNFSLHRDDDYLLAPTHWLTLELRCDCDWLKAEWVSLPYLVFPANSYVSCQMWNVTNNKSMKMTS